MSVDESAFISPPKWQVFIYLILYVTHLIVNRLRQLMYISNAARAQSPLCSLLTGISPPRFHIRTCIHSILKPLVLRAVQSNAAVGSFTPDWTSSQIPWASYRCSSSLHARCSLFHAIRFRCFTRSTCQTPRCRATPSVWFSSRANPLRAWCASRITRWTLRTPP